MLARLFGTTSLYFKHEAFWEEGPRYLSCRAYPVHSISCCWKAFDRLRSAAKNELHDYTCPACRPPLGRLSHTDLQEQTSQRKPGQDGCARDPTQSGCRKKQASWNRRSNDGGVGGWGVMLVVTAAGGLNAELEQIVSPCSGPRQRTKLIS